MDARDVLLSMGGRENCGSEEGGAEEEEEEGRDGC